MITVASELLPSAPLRTGPAVGAPSVGCGRGGMSRRGGRVTAVPPGSAGVPAWRRRRGRRHRCSALIGGDVDRGRLGPRLRGRRAGGDQPAEAGRPLGGGRLLARRGLLGGPGGGFGPRRLRSGASGFLGSGVLGRGPCRLLLGCPFGGAGRRRRRPRCRPEPGRGRRPPAGGHRVPGTPPVGWRWCERGRRRWRWCGGHGRRRGRWRRRRGREIGGPSIGDAPGPDEAVPVEEVAARRGRRTARRRRSRLRIPDRSSSQQPDPPSAARLTPLVTPEGGASECRAAHDRRRDDRPPGSATPPVMCRPMPYALGSTSAPRSRPRPCARDGRVEVVALGQPRAVGADGRVPAAEDGTLPGRRRRRRGGPAPSPAAWPASSSGGSATRCRSSLGGVPVLGRPGLTPRSCAGWSTTARRLEGGTAGQRRRHPPGQLGRVQAATSCARPLRRAGVADRRAAHRARGRRDPLRRAGAGRPGEVVAVYDLGGGTFDAAVLRRPATGLRASSGEPEGIERLGGIDFDEAVFEHVARGAPGQRSSSSTRDDADGRRRSPSCAGLRRGQGGAVQRRLGRHPRAAARAVVDGPAHPRGVRGHDPPDASVRPSSWPSRPSTGPRSAGAAVGGAPGRRLVAHPAGLRARRVRARRPPVRVDAHPKLVVARGAARWAATRPASAAVPAPTRRARPVAPVIATTRRRARAAPDRSSASGPRARRRRHPRWRRTCRRTIRRRRRRRRPCRRRHRRTPRTSTTSGT